MTHKGEANSRQAGQEILRFVWNSTVDFRARKIAPMDYTMSNIKLVHILSHCLLSLWTITSHLRLCLPNVLFHSSFPKKHVRIPSLHVCVTHLIYLLIITGSDKLETFRDISGKIRRTFKTTDKETFRSRVYTVWIMKQVKKSDRN